MPIEEPTAAQLGDVSEPGASCEGREARMNDEMDPRPDTSPLNSCAVRARRLQGIAFSVLSKMAIASETRDSAVGGSLPPAATRKSAIRLVGDAQLANERTANIRSLLQAR